MPAVVLAFAHSLFLFLYCLAAAAPEPVPVLPLQDSGFTQSHVQRLLGRPQDATTQQSLARHHNHVLLGGASTPKQRTARARLNAVEQDMYAREREDPRDPIPSESGERLVQSDRPRSLWHIDPKNPICVSQIHIHPSGHHHHPSVSHTPAIAL